METFATGNTNDAEQPDYETDSQGTRGSFQPWVSWFCSLAGHEYYAEVPEDFIEDDFNLTGLSAVVPYYNDALETILDVEYESEVDDNLDERMTEEDYKYRQEQRRLNSPIYPYAARLYGLIHQRYLLTRNGLLLMGERYASEQFGYCPRVYCGQCPVLPCGRYDEVDRDSVRLYCPSCMDLYNPPSALYDKIDGAHFGTTYPQLLFQTYSKLMPVPRGHVYQPRIFGFRVNERSRVGPRMQWLRMRPPEYILDEDEVEEEEEEEAHLVEMSAGKWKYQTFQPSLENDEQLESLGDQVDSLRMK
ncbi:casein kinase 2 regulatory subunit [Apophysomyces ossiformis]|uniref:Casein kinase II subunit beta n=1 Tax=Apophysomyces ossiformis TaxID=679940 RepID=A0A8H7BJQ2_9FUNG|nr:casein kinase 2 regulatory subunit [Apophysomyces ossiformis]